MSQKEFEAQLTLKDRLNFPYLLANQILTFQKALLALEFSEREVRETIEGFIHLIPQSWKDEAFTEEMAKAKITLKIDNRPLVAGNIRMSPEACLKLGLTPFEDKVTFDYYSLFQACINLLDRRGLTSRRTFTEKMTGKPFSEEPIDIEQ